MSDLTLKLDSQNHWLADGVQTVWNFEFSGGYINRSHVRAYYEDQTDPENPVRTDLVIDPLTDFVGDFQIEVTPAVPAGFVMVIYRATPRDLPLVDFQDGGGVTELNLDTTARQAVFLAQESADFLGVTTTADMQDLAQESLANAGAAAASASNAAASASSSASSAVAASASAAAALASEAAADNSAANAAAAASAAVTAFEVRLGDGTSAGNGADMVGFLYPTAYAAGTVGRWLKDLATDTGASLIGFLQLGTNAVLRTIRDKLYDEVNVLDFMTTAQRADVRSGAMALDVSGAWQAALDYASKRFGTSSETGYKVRFSGRHRISQPLVYTWRATSGGGSTDFRRLTLEGDGQGNTYLLYDGPSGSPAFSSSADVANIETYLHLKGFRLWRDLATPRIGTGMQLIKHTQTTFEDVNIGWFGLNLFAQDLLYFSARDSAFGGGIGGVLAQRLDFSHPNVYKWTRVNFSGCRDYGAQALFPANWSMDTCNFEGIGVGAGTEVACDIQGGPAEGGHGVTVHNSYFEGNFGLCDLRIAQGGANSGTHSITDNTFQRISPTDYVTNHVVLASTGAVSKVIIAGNGFKSFAGYVPGAGREAVVLNSANVDVWDSGNYYQNNVERPNYNGWPAIGEGMSQLAVAARVNNNGTSSLVAGSGWNVDSVARQGPGVTRVNYKKALRSATIVPIPQLVGSTPAGTAKMTAETTTYCEVTTLNTSGVATDYNFSLVAYGLLN